jgi:hypothetical protein
MRAGDDVRGALEGHADEGDAHAVELVDRVAGEAGSFCGFSETSTLAARNWKLAPGKGVPSLQPSIG